MLKTAVKENTFFKNRNMDYAYDSLTKVLNREVISSYLKYLIAENIPFSICLADIDNFKYVNDTYGHMMGDQVLYEFAQKIVSSVGSQGVVGRYGGDEFMIIVAGITEYKDIWSICHKMNKDLSRMHFEDFQELSVTLTTGISRFPLDGTSYEELVGTADKALYRGKTKGRNCFVIYLKEKHADIKLKPDKDIVLNTMDMHARVFNVLTNPGNLKDNIFKLFQYLSSTLMLDHICIETKDKMYISLIHSLSKVKEFQHIDYEIIDRVTNSIGLFFVNHRKTLLQVHHKELYDCMTRQQIQSMLACTMEAYGKHFGIIRVGMSGQRIWQSYEMDILLTAARLIATLLYHQNKTIDDL